MQFVLMDGDRRQVGGVRALITAGLRSGCQMAVGAQVLISAPRRRRSQQ